MVRWRDSFESEGATAGTERTGAGAGARAGAGAGRAGAGAATFWTRAAEEVFLDDPED